MSSSVQNTILAASAVTAAVAVVGLTVAQTDAVSRRILSAEQLQAKRMQEYAYRWQQSNEKAMLRVHYAVKGGVAALEAEQAQGQPNSAPSASQLWDHGSVKKLIDEWIAIDKQNHQEDKDKTVKHHSVSPFPRILGVTREESSRDLLLEVYHSFSGTYTLPFINFGVALADAMEATITTTALCFVADASSGLGSRFVADLMEASKAGVAIIREPIWMASLAAMAAQRVIAPEKMQRIIFGLCRMEALRVRSQVGDARTVMFTLPGQAVTPILLPLLQAAFPEDRHVFVYDGCVASVERALAQRLQYRRATVPKSLGEALQFCGENPASSDPTRITTPLRSSLTKSCIGLSKALAALRLYHADTTEAWMASVDAFFKLKEDEKNNGYLPYTLKLGLLLDNPSGSLEPETDRYYSLSSLMQYITGCRSRPLPEGVLDAAREWLRDFGHEHQREKRTETRFTLPERKAIENCVFSHKLILIEDKTLKDTVLPKQHWTLKQATKKGCACCAPEEDLDEEEDVARNTVATPMGNGGLFDPTKFSVPAPARSTATYVDGKTTFAFDPTKFS